MEYRLCHSSAGPGSPYSVKSPLVPHRMSALTRHRSLALLLGMGLLFGIVGSISAPAQSAPRAEPVEDDDVPRAVPVGPDGRQVPAPRAEVVEEMVRPAVPSAPKRSGPDEDLFDYATLIYDRQEYALAAQSFAKYLQDYPAGRHVALALFRIGECYMKQNQLDLARGYYEEVVNRYPETEGAPSAAYRLGAMKFNTQEFAASARYFLFCEDNTTLPQVKLAAAYNKSRAYQMMGDTTRQMTALREVVAIEEENPYRETALLTLGTALLAQDAKEEALPILMDLIQESKDKDIIADASVKAGVLQAEIGNPDEATKLLKNALAMPQTSEENRGIAMVGVIQAMFAKGDYDGVIDTYNRNSSVLPLGSTRPKMLLLVGNAYRMRKTYSRAVEVYLLIEQFHGETEEAFEASYWKLYCFYLLDDPDLIQFVNNFLTRYQREKQDHQFMALARLIRADAYFNDELYNEAAAAFLEVNVDRLPEKLRPGTLFNRGWSEAEAGRPQDAISTFTRFIGDYPDHELAAKALSKRGLARKNARDLSNAKKDFEAVIKKFPDSDSAEMAYLQLGLIATEQNDPEAMIAAFTALTEKFPQSKALGHAWYGIGSARFDAKEWSEAVQPLKNAIAKDSENFLDKASQKLILAFYAKQDPEGLAETIDGYRKINRNASVPPNVLTWLGLKFFDNKEFKRSARYLAMASTPDEPINTDPRVWNYLGMAQLETQDYDDSIVAIDNYLSQSPDSAAKARALLTKGMALLGKKEFDAANAVAEEGLEFVKSGKPQALLLILQGDIAMARGNQLQQDGDTAGAEAEWKAAAGKYAVPSQFMDDPEVTPESLEKSAIAFEKMGDPQKAKELRDQIKKRYPDYKGSN